MPDDDTPRRNTDPHTVLEVESASGAIATCRLCPSKGSAIDLALALITRADHPAEMGRATEPVDTPAGPRPTLKAHRLNLWQYGATECDGYRYQVVHTVLHPELRNEPDPLPDEDELDARENAAREANRVEPRGALLCAAIIALSAMAAVLSGAVRAWLR